MLDDRKRKATAHSKAPNIKFKLVPMASFPLVSPLKTDAPPNSARNQPQNPGDAGYPTDSSPPALSPQGSASAHFLAVAAHA